MARRLLALWLALLLLCTGISVYAALPPYKIGDANRDYKVTVTDARLALQHITGKTRLEAFAYALSDVNGDEVVNNTDARLILQYVVGKENPDYNIGRTASWEYSNGKYYVTVR